jgi:hypothetical protein
MTIKLFKSERKTADESYRDGLRDGAADAYNVAQGRRPCPMFDRWGEPRWGLRQNRWAFLKGYGEGFRDALPRYREARRAAVKVAQARETCPDQAPRQNPLHRVATFRYSEYLGEHQNPGWTWAIQAPSGVIGWCGRVEYRHGTRRDLEREACALSHNNIARIVAIAAPDGTRVDRY